ncbi:MAG: SUMF1/EgtB/PvdO family nonheme iron enzyme [Kiritimatiellaeota bacterium]|nr:SUMF1/EgtB/PvdO family nonheme iron enzyme [Kiritimatiellota bacterium]
MLVNGCQRNSAGRSIIRELPSLLVLLLGAVASALSFGAGGAQFTLTLNDGWNFVSVPIMPDDSLAETVFQNKIVGHVWRWDGKHYETTARVAPGVGYWVYHANSRDSASAGQVTVTIEGAALDVNTLELAKGWNAVGPLPDYRRPGYPAVLDETWEWDPLMRGLRVVSGSALTPGQGYWMFAPAPVAITFLSHTISGTITGDVLQGISLRLTGTATAETVSDADGSFYFGDLGAGTYRLAPFGEGVSFVPSSTEVVLGGADANGITFVSNQLGPSELSIYPALGIAARTEDRMVALTVPPDALVSAGGPVPGMFRSSVEPSVAVADSATLLTFSARLDLPAEAVVAGATTDAAYTFDLSFLANVPGDADARYRLGCIRIGFYEEGGAGRSYYEDFYATPDSAGTRETGSLLLRVPVTAVAGVRTRAGEALGEATIADGDVIAMFEAVVVDTSGYFGRIGGQADAAGATVYRHTSSALARDVDMFFLRWNPETQKFDNSDAETLDGKHVVVLLHGWQTLVGFGSDQNLLEPHRTTWRTFVEYATGAARDGPDLRQTLEFYTVRYDCDQRIYDNAVVIWQGLAAKFPGRQVTLLAYGSGGAIAHAMYQQFHPGPATFSNWPGGGIARIVSLNAPFHGTPLVQMLHPGGLTAPQAPVVVGSSLAFLACNTPGSVDLGWDGFDNNSLALWTNADLLSLNALGPSDLSGSYVTYATHLASDRDRDEAALADSGARIRAVFGSSYENDGVVPVRSARLCLNVGGSYVSRTTEKGATLGPYNHLEIYRGKASGDLNADQYDETLFGAIAASLVPPRDDLVLIPAGSFEMGDAQGDDSYGLETPVHTVHVPAFYMGRTEITNEQMRRVMQWAYDNGKITADTGTVKNAGAAAKELLDLDAANSQIIFYNGTFTILVGRENFPCTEVTWYGAAAYTAFRSEMEGKTPCFDLSDWSCDFSKSGYRLPTEAEWEKAARGGLAGQRFPWGNTITHQQANYVSSAAYEYDVSGTRGPHPDYASGAAPAGTFPANGYGLYETVGNVWEWCYDWYASHWYDDPGATADAPTGPVSGSIRVIRGGSAADYANQCRCSSRHLGENPTNSNNLLGFRVALSL